MIWFFILVALAVAVGIFLAPFLGWIALVIAVLIVAGSTIALAGGVLLSAVVFLRNLIAPHIPEPIINFGKKIGVGILWLVTSFYALLFGGAFVFLVLAIIFLIIDFFLGFVGRPQFWVDWFHT
jgi:hypothetical protein